MISMSSNGPQVAGKLAARAKRMSGGIDAACKSSGVSIRRIAAKNTPVVTGALRAGWDGPNMVGKWHYEVLNVTTNERDVPYGIFVEKGTWKMAGRHMLANAVHEVEPQHKVAIAAAIKAALR